MVSKIIEGAVVSVMFNDKVISTAKNIKFDDSMSKASKMRFGDFPISDIPPSISFSAKLVDKPEVDVLIKAFAVESRFLFTKYIWSRIKPRKLKKRIKKLMLAHNRGEINMWLKSGDLELETANGDNVKVTKWVFQLN